MELGGFDRRPPGRVPARAEQATIGPARIAKRFLPGGRCPSSSALAASSEAALGAPRSCPRCRIRKGEQIELLVVAASISAKSSPPPGPAKSR